MSLFPFAIVRKSTLEGLKRDKEILAAKLEAETEKLALLQKVLDASKEMNSVFKKIHGIEPPPKN